MSKFELSLSPDYVPHWNLQDALRELFQNALDQETQCVDNQFSYGYIANTLSIANKTSSLDTSTLLLGTTTKADDTSTIGKFGEGYKIAALVLTRLGKTLRIYNGDETWTFRFSRSKKYNSTILVCDVSTSILFWKSVDTNLIMCVDGITQAEFDELSTMNLHISTPTAFIETPKGRILLDPVHAGKIFVNGLFIVDTSTTPSISTYRQGYDFKPACIKLDRDRKLVTDGDIKWLSSSMWASDQAATSDPFNYKRLLKVLIDADAPDIQYLQYMYMGTSSMRDVVDQVHEEFLQTHGANAVPVYTQAELTDTLRDPSAKPILVSATQQSVMRRSSSYSYTPHVSKSVKERLEEWLSANEQDLQSEAVVEFNAILEDL